MTTAFGVVFYGFSVYVTEAAAGAEFSTSVLSLAYGGSLFVAALLTFPVGRHVDRYGARGVFLLGPVLATAGLLGFAAAREPWQVLAAWWLPLGVATAMIYYEPALVAIDQMIPAHQRPRALATLTLFGGLAGVAFIPLAERLTTAVGWRTALVVLAFGYLIVGVIGGTMALPRKRPSTPGRTDHHLKRPQFKERPYLLFTLGMVLAFAALQALIAHRIARFEEVGFAVAAVAAWAAAASLLSLPGRYVAPFLAIRLSPALVQAGALVLITTGSALAIRGTSSLELAGHFILFGLAFGPINLLRAMVMSDWYSGPHYGQMMGAQWTAVLLAGAVGPAAVGVLRDLSGSYSLSMVGTTLALALSVVAVLGAGRTGIRGRSAG